MSDKTSDDDLIVLNPLEIPEILEQILNYINTTKPLLCCRLVNHSWNHIAVKLLKKKKKCVTISLDSNAKIQEYVQLIQVNSNSRLSSFSLNLRIKLGEEEEEPLTYTIKPLLLATSRSFSIISGLTLIAPTSSSSSTPTLSNLTQLFEAVASTLTHLTLIGPINIINSNYESVPAPAYPRLSSITYYGSILRSTHPFLTSIIVNNNSNLKKLRLISQDNSEEVFPILAGLTTPQLHDQLNLVKLELSIYSSDIYSALCALNCPHLKNLRLHLQTTLVEDNVNGTKFSQFILQNAPNCTSLEFYCMERDGLIDHFVANLAPLRQITSFGFYLEMTVCDYDALADVVSERYLSMYWKFPSATTVMLDVQTLSCLTKYFSSLGGNSTSAACEFLPANFRLSISPLVTSIVVHLHGCYGYGMEDVAVATAGSAGPAHDHITQAYFSQRNTTRTINFLLNKLWPNCSDLTLKQQVFEPIHHSSSKNIHDCHVPLQHSYLLKSLPALKGLRRLKLKNYVHDWLNQMLRQEGDADVGEGANQFNLFGILSNLELLSIAGVRRGKVLQHYNFAATAYHTSLSSINIIQDVLSKAQFNLIHFLIHVQSVENIVIDEALLLLDGNPPGSNNSIMEEITTLKIATKSNIQLQ